MKKIWFWMLFLVPLTTQNILDGLSKLKTTIKKTIIESHQTEEVLQTLHYHRNPELVDAEYLLESVAACRLCPKVFDSVIHLRTSNDIYYVLEFFCLELGLPAKVCQTYVTPYADVLAYTINRRTDLTPEKVCNLLLHPYNCRYNETFNWSVNLPPKEKETKPKHKSDGTTFRILHLSDFHYDPEYTVNGTTPCKEMVCCQRDQGLATLPQKGCGCWGDYINADPPWRLIEETVKQTKTMNFDYVYYTGDTTTHRAIDMTVQKRLQIIEKVYDYLKTYYDVPVFVAFGNHDTQPVDFWKPVNIPMDKNLSMDWLLSVAAQEFSYLAWQNISKTVVKGGYYTVSPRAGFRVIVLNNNIASVRNFWLIFDSFDLYHQLQWLADTLKKAEENGEKVHIISHIPNGDPDLLRAWDREYSRILNRFASTITGQFNGHSHREEFRVFYNSTNRTQPIAVSFNGASVTPWVNSNPSFKYYTVDATTYSLLDSELYTFNLTLANSRCKDPPHWYKLYSFRETYRVNNLQPIEIDQLLHKMTKNHSLLDDYSRFYWQDANSSKCDERCKKNFLCMTVITMVGHGCHCERFLDLYDQTK